MSTEKGDWYWLKSAKQERFWSLDCGSWVFIIYILNSLLQLVEGRVKLSVPVQLTLTHADNHTCKSEWTTVGVLIANKHFLGSKVAYCCVQLLTCISIYARDHLLKVLHPAWWDVTLSTSAALHICRWFLLPPSTRQPGYEKTQVAWSSTYGSAFFLTRICGFHLRPRSCWHGPACHNSSLRTSSGQAQRLWATASPATPWTRGWPSHGGNSFKEVVRMCKLNTSSNLTI